MKLFKIIPFLLISVNCLAGNNKNSFTDYYPSVKQSTVSHDNSVFWIELNGGLSMAPGGRTIDALLGTSVDLKYINFNYRLYIARLGFHQGQSKYLGFPQQIEEIGLLTGIINYGDFGSTEFLYGLSFVMGNKNGALNPISTPYLMIYKKVPFMSIGIPFELKTSLIGRSIGIGISIDGNVNYYLPYIGLNVYFQINNSRK